MKKFICVVIFYIFIGLFFWFIFSIGNANFKIFEWNYDARAGYSLILSMVFVLFIIIYPSINTD